MLQVLFVGSFFVAVEATSGNFPFVKKHFSMIVIGIIVISFLPALISAIKAKAAKKKQNNNVTEKIKNKNCDEI